MSDGVKPSGPICRLIAFYLPQFHPIPENDAWWGKGFTEWTNVSRAMPLFPGHYQPHIPAHLGYYDLRVPEVRLAQADLAATHGLEGFCYWHYWFLGRRLLERPFNEVLVSGQPDFPFCLAWANESWSRRWLGEEREVLIRQTYSEDDDLSHIRWLIWAFADPRYVRIGGRPVFLVYRPACLPDPRRTTDLFRNECLGEGLPEPYLIGVDAHNQLDYRTLGFDATLRFEPKLSVLPDIPSDGLKTCDYAYGRRLMKSRAQDYPALPCVFVSWDNTARRGENPIVFTDASPERFESALREVADSVLERPYEGRLILINAWNEWAEGNHLEPDRRFGLGYLEAVRRVNCPGS
jgi:lipopolysaccharide biosynthesis protein